MIFIMKYTYKHIHSQCTPGCLSKFTFFMLDASNINLFLNQTSKNMKKKILGQLCLHTLAAAYEQKNRAKENGRQKE